MLNLYHLKYFFDACRHESLLEASRINRISHSAVSQAIRALEGELGVTLLVHAKRRFELSQEGAVLFREASEIFESLDRTIQSVTSASEKLQGPIRVGLSHSVGLGPMSAKIAEFCRKHPGLEPTIRVGASAVLENLLKGREIELGLGVEETLFANFESRELLSGRFVLVASPQAATASDCFLVGDKGVEVILLRKYLRDANRKVRFITIQSWELIAQLAAQGVGVGLLPDYFMASNGKRTLKTVKLDLALPTYTLRAYFRSERSLSAGARALLGSLQTAKKAPRGR